MAAAAHDIRSPLTAMKGFGYALEKRWEIMTEDQRALMLQGIVYDADRMDAILRLLVDAGRVASGTLEMFPERVELAELAWASSKSRRRDPEHPEVRWAGQRDVVVADPARVKSAILSFIEAQAWWGREGPITIEGGPGRRPVAVDRVARRDRAHDRATRRRCSRHAGPGRARAARSVSSWRAASPRRRAAARGQTSTDGRLSFHLDVPLASRG